MRYVNKRLVIFINKLCVRMTGGLTVRGTGIRQGANLGFVDRIFENEVFGTPIYADMYEQAAAYLFYVLKNHVFLDGNKRTGLACAITFLQWNGVRFGPLDEDAVFDFVMGVAAGVNDSDAQLPVIATWLRGLTVQGLTAAP